LISEYILLESKKFSEEEVVKLLYLFYLKIDERRIEYNQGTHRF
jgi:hypothetical protein